MRFFDTNVLVYGQDARDARKQAKALDLLVQAIASNELVLSTQVLVEFYSVVTAKKMRTPERASALCKLWAECQVVHATPDLVLRAFELQQRHQFSVWDALVIQAALDAGCHTLYSEDLQHGMRLGSLEIVNPFLQAPAGHEPVPPYRATAQAARSSRRA